LRTAIKPFAAVLLFALAVASAFRALRGRYYRVEVAGDSMRPTLRPGEFLVLRRGAPTPGEVQPGSIVALHDATGRLILKRVIGLPGETVEIRQKQVYIDGEPLEEPYVHFLEPPISRDHPEYGLRGESRRDDFGPEKIPEGQLFVLGDNRDNSRDSRFWGYLPMDQVKGRALLVYWSYEASREEYRRTGVWDWIRDTASAVGRTRWRRFFHVIR